MSGSDRPPPEERARRVALFLARYGPDAMLEINFQDNAGQQYVGLLRKGTTEITQLKRVTADGDHPVLDTFLDTQLLAQSSATFGYVAIVTGVFGYETGITGIIAFTSLLASSAMQRFIPSGVPAVNSLLVASLFAIVSFLTAAAYVALQVADSGHELGQARGNGLAARLRVTFFCCFVVYYGLFVVTLSILLPERGFIVTEFAIELWVSSMAALVSCSRDRPDIRTGRLWWAMMGGILMVWALYLVDTSPKRDWVASLGAMAAALVVTAVRFAWVVRYAMMDKYLINETTDALIDMYTLAVFKSSRFCSCSCPRPSFSPSQPLLPSCSALPEEREEILLNHQ